MNESGSEGLVAYHPSKFSEGSCSCEYQPQYRIQRCCTGRYCLSEPHQNAFFILIGAQNNSRAEPKIMNRLFVIVVIEVQHHPHASLEHKHILPVDHTDIYSTRYNPLPLHPHQIQMWCNQRDQCLIIGVILLILNPLPVQHFPDGLPFTYLKLHNTLLMPTASLLHSSCLRSGMILWPIE